MARGTGLTLLLMVASLAASLAAPGVVAPLPGSDCGHAGPAMQALEAEQSPAPATRILPGPPEATECDAEPDRVYRHWHHGGTKLDASCEPFANPPGGHAQGG